MLAVLAILPLLACVCEGGANQRMLKIAQDVLPKCKNGGRIDCGEYAECLVSNKTEACYCRKEANSHLHCGYHRAKEKDPCTDISEWDRFWQRCKCSFRGRYPHCCHNCKPQYKCLKGKCQKMRPCKERCGAKAVCVKDKEGKGVCKCSIGGTHPKCLTEPITLPPPKSTTSPKPTKKPPAPSTELTKTTSAEDSTTPEPTELTTKEDTTTPEPTEPTTKEDTTTPEPTEPTTKEDTTTPEPTEPTTKEDTTTLEPTEPTTKEDTTTPEPTEPTTKEDTTTPEPTEPTTNIPTTGTPNPCGWGYSGKEKRWGPEVMDIVHSRTKFLGKWMHGKRFRPLGQDPCKPHRPHIDTGRWNIWGKVPIQPIAVRPIIRPVPIVRPVINPAVPVINPAVKPVLNPNVRPVVNPVYNPATPVVNPVRPVVNIGKPFVRPIIGPAKRPHPEVRPVKTPFLRPSHFRPPQVGPHPIVRPGGPFGPRHHGGGMGKQFQGNFGHRKSGGINIGSIG